MWLINSLDVLHELHWLHAFNAAHCKWPLTFWFYGQDFEDLLLEIWQRRWFRRCTRLCFLIYAVCLGWKSRCQCGPGCLSPSVCLLCLSALSVCSVCLLCLSALSVCSACLLVFQSHCLSLCLSALSVSMSFSLCLLVCLSVFLSLCLFQSPRRHRKC